MLVYDVNAGVIRDVPRAEAAAGAMRYARSLGPGTAACGEAEKRALEIARREEADAEHALEGLVS